MKQASQSFDIEPSGFFVMRTPLLPFDEVESWSSGLEAPAVWQEAEQLRQALAADREMLRERLEQYLQRSEINEALFIAAPDLELGIKEWRHDPASKKGRRGESALVRYFLRMATRPTPFGIFAGCSTGTIGGDSELTLDPRSSYQRHTRLDMDYLFALCEDLSGTAEIRQRLRYFPNTSLYRIAERLRYAEARLQGKARSYHLVAVEADDFLDLTLDRATTGATIDELAHALVAADPDDEISLEEATEFIEELIDTKILVSQLWPNVTGREPIHDLISRLNGLELKQGVAPQVASTLAHVRDSLQEINAAGLGIECETYRALAKDLQQLPTRVELSRLFQVDMTKPAVTAHLGPEVVAELKRGVDILHRMVGQRSEDGLSAFRQGFITRYGEGKTVPLTEALDEESGIGFGTSGRSAAPLIDGLGLGTQPAGGGAPPPPRHQATEALALQLLEKALSEGKQAVELNASSLSELGSSPIPLPDAFQVMATIAADSPDALQRGELQIHLENYSGPSGARLLGRFCHTDPQLRKHVERHLEEEEALQPDAVFAEIVHLPEGRVGNILARPVLRQHEISYLGQGEGDTTHQIPVSDLMVSVTRGEVVLSSARLGKRVIPRLTTAHNYSNRSLCVYRFLCSLQSQGVAQGMRWTWGSLESAAFLPRITCGRLVLSLAQWRVTADEIKSLQRHKDEVARYQAVQEWRTRRGLPRLVHLADSDHKLLVDFDNILSIDALLSVIKRRPLVVLSELFPGPDQLCVRSPEGRFVQQLVIPFISRRRPTRSPQVPRQQQAARAYPPASEWLYVKLYCGVATADQVLTEVVKPVVTRALASGAADQWFFIRYADPEWHLRVRFHGPPERLMGEVLPALYSAVSPLLESGLVWSIQLDTYLREVERYGGEHGIELSEMLFQVDSEAVTSLVEMLGGDAGAEARWRLALRGSLQLLVDLGFDEESRLQILSRMQDTFAREFAMGKQLKQSLASRLRQLHGELDGLLQPEYSGHPLAPAIDTLTHRSQRLAPIVAALQEKEQAKLLTMPLADMAPSYIHMFNNRLIRSEARTHELVLYDFLNRAVRSQIARKRKA
jgi:thiopeptide-type bacteriocin biosynthesis protein